MRWFLVRYAGGKTARIMAVSADEALMHAAAWGRVLTVELETSDERKVA